MTTEIIGTYAKIASAVESRRYYTAIRPMIEDEQITTMSMTSITLCNHPLHYSGLDVSLTQTYNLTHDHFNFLLVCLFRPHLSV